MKTNNNSNENVNLLMAENEQLKTENERLEIENTILRLAYKEFEKSMLGEPKENIIIRLWIKEKQLESLQAEYEQVKSTNGRLDVENTALRLAINYFKKEQ